MAEKITITEALAELKTIGKRLDKKLEFMTAHVFRQEQYKDPLEKDGGSALTLERERQSYDDLCGRLVRIRAAIAQANARERIQIGSNGRTVDLTIADWLVWRREVAPRIEKMHVAIRGRVDGARQTANQRGFNLVLPGEGKNPTDVIVNVNERVLAQEIEGLQETLGRLDGMLSLKNALVTIEV